MRYEWNGSGIERVRLRRHVTAAVLVIDDFTGRPITAPDLTVTAAQVLRKPVRKGDGYFLFLDCEEPVLDMTARAWAYHTAETRVEVGQLSPLHPVVKLRLTPNRNYSIPSQTTCLEGRGAPGTEVRVLCENDPRPLRLLYDYAPSGVLDGRFIQLYDPSGSDWEGRLFALRRKGEGELEYFQVRSTVDGEEGGCLLAAPLSRGCKKAGATVFPVSAARADEKGAFFIPLRTMAVKAYTCRVLSRAPGGDWEERSLELEPGRVTRLDLLGG